MLVEATKTLVEQTTDKIIAFIKTHDLKIGNKLPNEYQLSQELDIGRSTLREAVRVLVSRNILEVRQGSGTFISDKRGIATDPLGFSLIKDQDKMILDLFELRYLLEPKMAALAAKNASEEQIQRITYLKDEIEISFLEGTDDHVQLDIELHTTIAQASGNVGLTHIIPVINESIALFNKSYNVERLKRETITLHSDIVEAISNHDELEAFDTMTVHMATNRKEFRKIMKKK